MRGWKTAPRISRKHKLRSRKGDSAEQSNSPPLKALLDILPLDERRAQGTRDRHILEDAPLPLNAKRHNFFSYCLAIPPCELDQLIEPAGGLKQRISQVECQGRAIALLPGFEVVKEPPNVGEEQIADLGFLVERGVDLGKRVFHVPVPVGKGKRGADLLEARRILPFP